MFNQTEASSVLRTHLKEQSAQVEALRATLDDFIKKRENRSHLNQFAVSYGEASWWKKSGIFVSFLATCGAIIYAAGLSPIWMLPAIGLYLMSVYFLSNHYKAHQAINTKTLEVLEAILTESIDSVDELRKQFSAITSACSTLYQSEAKEQTVLKEQITSMQRSNAAYKTAVGTLEPLVDTLNETEQAVYQKSQALLSILDETHAALVEEKKEIIEKLSPEVDLTIGLFKIFQAHIGSLERHFQKNVIQINTFVSELDSLLYQLENKRDAADEAHLIAFEKTKGLMNRADDVLERAMRFLEKTSKDLMDEVTPGFNLNFFGAPPNAPYLVKPGELLSCPQ